MFKFDLAIALGKTISELDRELGEAELYLWLAYDSLKGLPRPWLQTGVLAAVTNNSSLNRTRAAGPMDFIPRSTSTFVECHSEAQINYAQAQGYKVIDKR